MGDYNKLTGIHFLLTYTCNFECDHCFLYCSPNSLGVFTIDQINHVLDEAENIGTIEWIFYEGGEPFLYFPLLVESIRQADSRGFKTGVVTNAYGANSKADAKLWLKPLADAGITFLSISNDTFHYGDEKQNSAFHAAQVAEELGIDHMSICIEPPHAQKNNSLSDTKGKPIVGGIALFRGRAVESLANDLPLRAWDTLTKCPYEELKTPKRLHIDPFGHVHICQGISMGNLWQIPLSKLVSAYQAEHHPICGPLITGGPAKLAKVTGYPVEKGYIDECHLCYLVRRSMIDQYQDYLTPRQVYGLID